MISPSECSDPASCVREAERILRYSFHNPRLLQEALTHSTFSHGAISYERLEFVGDAALSLALAKHWYSSRPDFGPHHLTILKSVTLCNDNLARAALKRGIYPLIRHNCPGLDKEVTEFKKTIKQEAEKNQIHRGSTKKAPKVLADVVEAIAAAVYEDCNFNLDLMWKVVKRLLKPLKTLGQTLKIYKLLQRSEKDKFCNVQKVHTTSVKFPVGKKHVGSGSSKQKRIARLIVAHNTVKKMRREKPNLVIKSKPKQVVDKKDTKQKLCKFRTERQSRSKKASSGSSELVSSGSCQKKRISKLNAAQEITTHPKDYPDFKSSKGLTNVPLNEKNYISWAKSARVSLKEKGLLGFITGDRKRPKKSGDAQVDWNIADGQTVTLILNSLGPQLSKMFCYYDTAIELWQAIENQYCNQNNHSRVYHLKKEIAKLSQENSSIPELIRHVRAKYQELKLLNPSSTNLEVLQEREETDQVYTFLAALNSSYEAIGAQILLSEQKLTFASVTAIIQQEYSRRAAMGTSDSKPRSEGHASAASTFISNKGKENGKKEKCKYEKDTEKKLKREKSNLLIKSKPKQVRDEKDDKQKLREFCMKRRWSPPVYKLKKEKGPAHCKMFLCSVHVKTTNDNLVVLGEYRSKVKDAEKSAALKMQRKLQLSA